MQTTDQTDLAHRLLDDDESVLEDILRQLGPSVTSVLRVRYRGVLNDSDLEDLLSMGLYRLWNSRGSFDPERGRLQVWFFRIVDNAARDVLRRGWQKARQLERHHEPDVLPEPSQNGHGSILAPTADGEDRPRTRLQQDLQNILNQLPAAQKQILLADAAARDDVASSQWLSEQLKLPASTIRVYRKRALERVRRDLEQRGHSPPS